MSWTVLCGALAGVAAAAATLDAAAALAQGWARGRAGAARRRSRTTPRSRAVTAVARLGRHLGMPAPPGDLAARIDAAGAPGGLDVGDVMALKCGSAAVALAVAGPAAAGMPARPAVALAVGAPAAAFLAPDAWLRRRARRRAAVMQRELADVLDLVRVAVSAGLPTGRALAEVGARRSGLLASELAGAAARMDLGVPRAQALQRLAARCPLESVAALTAAIGRSDRHGAPLAPALAALAADARAQRACELRDRAARAAPKIQLVIALALVPSVLLLVAAALADSLA